MQLGRFFEGLQRPKEILTVIFFTFLSHKNLDLNLESRIQQSLDPDLDSVKCPDADSINLSSKRCFNAKQ
jgi:hypothetical protein